ncbi:MAG: hypothetical protein EZS28_028071 [Streblomastix strix]|uniref:Uncharacterized protein n=1 Tax=Streblomastix strix TaxID=222440 RepID=A0A5J4V204_9EUKA|nr:MAG: hypothetical protein EZS28_028071 [Streblomastix strix]
MLNDKQTLDKDMKINQELRTIRSGEAYIADKKGVQEYVMKMANPDGEGSLLEFATVYTNKEKLYSIGGYIPKDESKETNQIEKLGREWNMAAAQATRREVLREILSAIDSLQNWSNYQIVKQGAAAFKKQVALVYFSQVNTDEEAFSTEIDRLYNQFAPAAINKARRRQEAMQLDRK